MAGGFPKHVEQFVASTIVSIQQLEVLLHLAAHPERGWSADELGAALRTNREAAANWLLVLAEAGLAEREGDRYRYAAKGRQRRTVAELAEVYRTYRTRVIALVYGKPDDPARGFADAFRLRRGVDG